MFFPVSLHGSLPPFLLDLRQTWPPCRGLPGLSQSSTTLCLVRTRCPSSIFVTVLTAIWKYLVFTRFLVYSLSLLLDRQLQEGRDSACPVTSFYQHLGQHQEQRWRSIPTGWMNEWLDGQMNEWPALCLECLHRLSSTLPPDLSLAHLQKIVPDPTSRLDRRFLFSTPCHGPYVNGNCLCLSRSFGRIWFPSGTVDLSNDNNNIPPFVMRMKSHCHYHE